MHIVFDLADLAEVARPSTPDSPGGRHLVHVAAEVQELLSAFGPRLHADGLRGAAETPLIGMTDAEVFAVFVDLALWGEGERRTELAVIAVGLRLGAAMTAMAAGAASPR